MKNYGHLLTILFFTFITAFTLFQQSRTTHAIDEKNNSIVISEIFTTGVSQDEWIEITNTSITPIDITGWKFYEAKTRHGLTSNDSSYIIEPGSYAIIANNATQFTLTHPQIQVKLFDSSWSSLSTDGEEIGLKNNEDEFIELFTYTKNTENSLQKIDLHQNLYDSSNWHDALETPGKQNFTHENNTVSDSLQDEENATTNVDVTPIYFVDANIATSNIDLIPNDSTKSIDTIQIQLSNQNDNNNSKNIQSETIGTPHAIINIQSGETEAIERLTLNVDGSESYDTEDTPLTYHFDFGDGYMYEKKNPPPHTYKTPGKFTLKLTVSNGHKSSSDTLLITVFKAEDNKSISNKNNPTDNTKKENKQLHQQTGTSAKKEEEIIREEIIQSSDVNLKILLSEIYPNPKGSDKGNEWIEIYNPNSIAIDLNNYSIDDYEDGGSKKFTLSESKIQPYSFEIISHPSFNVNNSDERIGLYNKSDRVIDEIFFDESIEDASYSKVGNQWLWTIPTPAQENSEITKLQSEGNETSEFKNGDLSSEIYINEILPNPEGEDSKTEWIEIYNDSNNDVNLGNWVLDDKDGGSKQFLIPDTIIIKAHGYLIFERADTKISLDNKSDSVRLINFENEIQDEISYEKAKENLSYARIKFIEDSNESYEWKWMIDATKKTSNQVLHKLKGEVERKENDQIFVKSEALNLPESNELTEKIFNPGNILELTYDQNKKILDYTLVREKESKSIVQQTNKFIIWSKVAMYILLLYIGYKLYGLKTNTTR